MATEADFVALMSKHAAILRRVSSLYTANAADRRDLAQEITLQLWKGYPRYDPSRSFSTWMYRIALNVAISFLRGPGNPSRRALSLDELGLDPADTAATDLGDTDERTALLRRFITQLDPLNRALMLLYLDERSYREIADVLGLSETNVATKISRLKQRIRLEIAPPQ